MQNTIIKLESVIRELESYEKKKAVLLSIITEDREYTKEYINKIREFIKTM